MVRLWVAPGPAARWEGRLAGDGIVMTAHVRSLSGHTLGWLSAGDGTIPRSR